MVQIEDGVITSPEETPAAKPGWQTTEFWITLAGIIVSFLVAQNVAFQLEKRIAFRRAMKRAMDQSMNAGVEGIKIRCAGRLNGVEIARQESYTQGKLPLHTLRAKIDYGFAESLTKFGIIGVKVWIFNGEVFSKKDESVPEPA